MPVAAWFSDLLPGLTTRPLEALFQHYELLQRWNQRMNLTSEPPGRELVERHYCESLFFGENLPETQAGVSIADIGSGAGFPGFPMAVLRPQWSVTLVESNQRKSVFLREASREIPNIRVISKRAEEVEEHFDWIVSRAVRPEDVGALVPRLGPNIGLMLVEREFSQIRSSPHIAWNEPVRLPWGEHRLCVYGKSIKRST